MGTKREWKCNPKLNAHVLSSNGGHCNQMNTLIGERERENRHLNHGSDFIWVVHSMLIQRSILFQPKTTRTQIKSTTQNHIDNSGRINSTRKINVKKKWSISEPLTN